MLPWKFRAVGQFDLDRLTLREAAHDFDLDGDLTKADDLANQVGAVPDLAGAALGHRGIDRLEKRRGHVWLLYQKQVLGIRPDIMTGDE